MQPAMRREQPSFSSASVPTRGSEIARLHEQHPSLADEHREYISGIITRHTESENPKRREAVLERLRAEAEHLLGPLQDLHDVRMELSYLLFHNGGFVSPEDVARVKGVVEEFRRDAALLQLIHVYPVQGEETSSKNELVPLYMEMLQVSGEVLKGFPLLYARVHQMYEIFLGLLSEGERELFADQHERTTWNLCSPGGFFSAESHLAQREREHTLKLPEHERLSAQLENQLDLLQNEITVMKEGDGVSDDPEREALLAVKNQRLEKLMRRKRELKVWEEELPSLQLKRLAILTPLNWVLQDICDPDVRKRLKEDAIRLKTRDIPTQNIKKTA